ncbi:MAG TPA: cyclopropane-fatty-acyl-phospholipid synthase family protein [Alphaproteobacteria bacterium]|nr:cyclopropane-fatty-acyl-phospholipid synthase family protein [Alphaproteobacteria bacterium]
MLVAHSLGRLIQVGTLRVVDANGRTHVFGDGKGPRSTIRLHDPRLHHRLFFRPSLALGEGYMDGTLTIEEGDLYGFLDLVLGNLDRLESSGRKHPVQAFYETIQRWARPLRTFNPAARAKRNVAHHYDLSGRLYDLFLDKDRQYSCAYFTSGNESLEIAQDNKKRHIASKLLLEPGVRILDIGSGWGGLALFLARTTKDARVTGVTLSEEQVKVARARAAEAGLAERVNFELTDYRKVDQPFDRIVSVGMFEHVGPNHYVEFFRKVKDLLTDDGVCLLHSIGRSDGPGATGPWLRKYIFPGGYSPALSEAVAAIEKVGLWITDVEILRLHYAKTLNEWRRRFMLNRDEVKALYDERFCRMWEFYLAGCEAAFHHLRQMVFQVQITKRLETAPLTRDYMVDWERAHGGEGDLSAGSRA